ncbi:MAG: BON domain-containing protein [Betaproteobacteria bacterium]
MNKKLIAALLLGATVLPALQGCFPLVAAGVTSGIMAAVDRRSVGTQTEDETIEWKAAAHVREKFGDRVHLNFTSYNRKVLITGEVPTTEAKAEVEQLISAVANVQGAYNEIVVGPISSYSDRSNDSFITTKVKSRSVDNGKFNPLHAKVITEAGIVFVLGMLTQPEADAAIDVARTTSGVRKVVNVLEIITPAKARELDMVQASGKTAPPNP